VQTHEQQLLLYACHQLFRGDQSPEGGLGRSDQPVFR